MFEISENRKVHTFVILYHYLLVVKTFADDNVGISHVKVFGDTSFYTCSENGYFKLWDYR